MEVNPSCPSFLWTASAWRGNQKAKPSQGLEPLGGEEAKMRDLILQNQMHLRFEPNFYSPAMICGYKCL